MRLKNVLIVVEDIKRSQKFYQELFGLRTIADFDGNMVLTEGLVLQERGVWEDLIQRGIVPGDGDMELYFEENDLDGFLEKLEAYPEKLWILWQNVSVKRGCLWSRLQRKHSFLWSRSGESVKKAL